MGFFRSDFTTEKIDENTTLIKEYLFGSPAYMYLLEGADRAALIDSGMGGGDLASVVKGLTNKEVMVFNTHGHFDHCGANRQFGAAYIHALDLPVLKLQQNRRYFNAMLPVALRILFSWTLRRIMHEVDDEMYHFINDGDTFDLGGRTLEVITVPGHSVGSVCFLDREKGYLFSGDTVVSVGVLLNLCGSTPVQTFLRSQQKLQTRRDEWGKIFAGHNAYPIDSGFIARYIQCADGVIDKTNLGAANKKHGFPVSYNDVRIELPKDARVLALPPDGHLPFIEGGLL